MKLHDLKATLVGIINTRANIIAFRKTIERYNCKQNKASEIYNTTIFVVTLDRLMQEYYELENK